MLVDSHCHLDFPDFADDLDGVSSGRGDKASAGLVTISTARARVSMGCCAIADALSGRVLLGRHASAPCA